MADFIKADIRGLKCDNYDCDYVDMTIPYESYEKYVNAECPKCSENLLTEEDYESVKLLVEQAQKLNAELLKRSKEEEFVVETGGESIKVSVDLDGKGGCTIKVSKTNGDGKVEYYKGISEYWY